VPVPQPPHAQIPAVLRLDAAARRALLPDRTVCYQESSFEARPAPAYKAKLAQLFAGFLNSDAPDLAGQARNFRQRRITGNQIALVSQEDQRYRSHSVARMFATERPSQSFPP